LRRAVAADVCQAGGEVSGGGGGRGAPGDGAGWWTAGDPHDGVVGEVPGEAVGVGGLRAVVQLAAEAPIEAVASGASSNCEYASVTGMPSSSRTVAAIAAKGTGSVASCSRVSASV